VERRRPHAERCSNAQQFEGNYEMTETAQSQLQVATFGAGCFWGVEETFRNLKGVTATSVGYSGGTMVNPAYHDVCTGRTGHAEVVEVAYDPSQVTYEELLNVFWNNHNPTTPNRQGWDIGSQYRSAIFFHNSEQEAIALRSKEALERSGKFRKRIVTEITLATPFYRAEDYHQQYLAKRGMGACHV
jgi:peptide-methionine (S)-S-oxide reductase